jgi:hypothetical protein
MERSSGFHAASGAVDAEVDVEVEVVEEDDESEPLLHAANSASAVAIPTAVSDLRCIG